MVAVIQVRQKAQAVNQTLLDETKELEEILAKGDTAVREVVEEVHRAHLDVLWYQIMSSMLQVEEKAKKIETEKKELDKQVSEKSVASHSKSVQCFFSDTVKSCPWSLLLTSCPHGPSRTLLL